jgi:phage shock protein PspC (stress-responsive transcriptional regulator)
MKKMVSINLAGRLFHINEEAYHMLRSYLDAVAEKLPGEEREEILQEIELRVAELLAGMITEKRQVIELEQVKEVIQTLGDPEEFEESAGDKQKTEHSHMRYNKRLYRDPDNRVLGGVCGGLGAYFNIDPVLFRFLFIIVFLVFGAGLIVYLILWLITPEAVTMAQKMEMKGQAFTFDDFKKKARWEYEDVKNQFKRKKGS